MELINDRYEVVEVIHNDLGLLEYLVRDRHNWGILKRMRVFDVEMSNVRLLKQFESTFVDLKNHRHENILNLYEFSPLLTYDGSKIVRHQYYYTYEHVDGERVSYLDLEKSQIMDVIVQLCKIMRFLHYRGVVYKYLNFDNLQIYVTAGKRAKVKLADLVSVGIIDYNNKTSFDYTSDFVAPEVNWGENVDYSADIYSLGMMFYYLYFKRDYRHKSITKLQPSNPLNHFITKAISQVYEERHADIFSFIEEMSKLVWLEVPSDDIQYYDRIQENVKLVGRDDIVGDVMDLIDRKTQKLTSVSAVKLVGEDGSGKSRVLREISQMCKFKRYNYVSLKLSTNAEEYHCTREIIRYILSLENQSSSLISKYGAEVSLLVPEQKINFNSNVESINLERDYLRIVNRSAGFVRDFCSSQYLIIIIDDGGNMGERDRMFFEQLLYSVQSISCLVVYSGCELKTRRMEDSRDFNFTYLNINEIGLMVQSFLGTNYVPFNIVHRLFIETQGRASQIRELLMAYYNTGIVSFHADKCDWVFSEHADSYKIERYVRLRDERHDLSAQEHSALIKLATLNYDFNSATACHMLQLSCDEVDELLRKLQEKKLLSQRISDVEYVFNFVSNHLRNTYLNMQTVSDKKKLAARAAEYFIHKFETEHVADDGLVLYLETAGDNERVVEYAKKLAVYYNENQAFSKSTEMLEIVENVYRKNGNTANADELWVTIAERARLEGSVQKAMDMVQDRTFESVELRIRALNLITNVYLNQSKLQEAKSMCESAIELAEAHGYWKHYLECVVNLCIYYDYADDDRKLMHALNDAVGVAIRENFESYRLYFYALLSMLKWEDAADKRPEVAFEEAIYHLEKTEFSILLTDMYDAYAMRYCYAIGAFDKSRELLRKSENKASKNGYLAHAAEYNYYMGITFWTESRMTIATKYLEDAVKIARKYLLHDIAVNSLAVLAHVKLYLGDYRQGYIHLSKLEYDLHTGARSNVLSDSIFLFRLDYFYSMNDLRGARALRLKHDSAQLYSDLAKYRLKILDLKFEYLNSILYEDFKLRDDTMAAFYDLVSGIGGHSYAKYFREFILDVALNLVMSNDITHITNLLKLDESQIKLYDNRVLRIKRDIVSAFINDYTVDRIVGLMDYVPDMPNEVRWRMNFVLGRIYYENKDYKNSLMAYLAAFDVIMDIVEKVPEIFRTSYILNDPFKIVLKAQLNSIIRRLGGQDISNPGSTDSLLFTVDDYFDLSNLVELLEDDAVASVLKGEPIKANDYALVQQLTKSNKDNLESILRHMADLTFAHRGFLYIMNEDDVVADIIKLNKDDEPIELPHLIYSMGNDVDGIVASKLNHTTQVKLLKGNQKGIIYFPVMELHNEKGYERRKEDMLETKQRIVAYVFLETNDLINRFNHKIFEQVKAFSKIITIFVDNYNLRISSTLDKLTGVYLRKYFEQQFEVTMTLSRKRSEKFSVVLLDIDKFKVVNDTYGHRMGDKILAGIGSILQQSTRSTDLVGRYGGEEFILLLPNTDRSSAYNVAEKIRKNVEAARLLGNEMPLTVSLGIATFPEDGASEEELIENADKAMYCSKETGRNRATSWDKEMVINAKRYDNLSGIITGQLAEDSRNVQAILKLMSYLALGHDKKTVRKDVFQTLLDVVHAQKIEFYSFDAQLQIKEAYQVIAGVDSLDEIEEPDYRNIERYGLLDRSDYFIDWDNHLNESNDEIPDWESIIVLAYNSKRALGMLLIKVPISENEFTPGNHNFITSMKDILERIIF